LRKPASHFVGLARHVDINPFLAELDAAPDMWLLDTSRQRKVRCQRHTRNIFLRAPQKPLPPGARNANDVHESRSVPAARRFPRTLAWCESIAAALGGKLGRATLVTLLPHSRVYPHVDAGAYYRIRDRFHLVLRSLRGSPLTCDGETVGWVTSGGFCHHLDASIALGYVPSELAGRTSGFQIEILGEMRDAVVLPEPPFDPTGSRMRS